MRTYKHITDPRERHITACALRDSRHITILPTTKISRAVFISRDKNLFMNEVWCDAKTGKVLSVSYVCGINSTGLLRKSIFVTNQS